MIYTKIKNIETYLGISKNLDTAIRFLREYDLNDLGKGKTVIDQDEVFVNHFCYQTVEEKDASWEGHIRYADMHILLSGNEKIGINNIPDSKLPIISNIDNRVAVFKSPFSSENLSTATECFVVTTSGNGNILT